MLRIDGRVLAAAVVGVFVLGAALGFVVGGVGGVGGGTAADTGSTPTPAPSPAPTSTPTDADTTAPPNGTLEEATATSTPTGTPTRSTTATVAPTPTPSPTPTPTLTPTPTPTVVTPVTPNGTPTRTPILIRRFDEAEIERELRRMLNEWRTEQGLEPFTLEDGTLVAELNAMAENHSVAMADANRLAHELDNTSSADRYRERDLYWNCVFEADHNAYVVTPSDNDLEVLAKTYAGITYRTVNGTEYNENETEVARAVFDFLMANDIHRDRLAERNASRIGIGIETTRNNEVFVTGNLCGS